jgi:hypothetical protein
MRMTHWMMTCLLTLGIALPALGNPVVSVSHVYIAKNAAQSAAVTVTDGGDAATEDIEGMTFALQISAGIDSTPSISSVDLLTNTIWSGHVSASNVNPAGDVANPQFKLFSIITNNAGEYVSANGTLATATLNTTGAMLGDYTLKLIGTKYPGSDSQFTNGLGNPVAATFGSSTLTVVAKGDFNRDNQLTSADIPAMLSALTDLAAYQSTYGVPAAELLAIGDFTGDGNVTNADIQPLLDLVSSTGGGSVQSVPEPATWSLLAWGIGMLAVAARWQHRFKNLARIKSTFSK